MNTAPMPAELAALRELVASLKAALDLSQQENTLLRQKIDSLVRRVFGSSSERLDTAQLELRLQLPKVPRRNHPLPRLKNFPARSLSPVATGGHVCRNTCRWTKRSSNLNR